jgi:acyl-CoA synthetase (AMP-forming)/AMP-acid ligase II
VITTLPTFADILHRRAADQPYTPAFRFREGAREDHITYSELDERACAVAALLQEHDVCGRTVLLLLDPGLDYVAAIFGCWYAGAIAVPAGGPGAHALAADARPAIALTTAPALAALDLPSATTWLALEDAAEPAAWSDLPAERLDPAFPRLSHTALLDNAATIREALDCSPLSTFVSWLPPHHGVGLAIGILQPIYEGVPAVLLSPVEFFDDPLSWLRAISGTPDVIAAAPDSAYELCVRKVAPDDRVGLNLEGWRVALHGGGDTMRSFAEAYAVSGFRPEAMVPANGLAEALLDDAPENLIAT